MSARPARPLRPGSPILGPSSLVIGTGPPHHHSMAGHVRPDFERIAEAGDASQRAKSAHDALRAVDAERATLIELRRVAVADLRRQGWSWTGIAALLGIHRNRAAHLLDRHESGPKTL